MLGCSAMEKLSRWSTVSQVSRLKTRSSETDPEVRGLFCLDSANLRLIRAFIDSGGSHIAHPGGRGVPLLSTMPQATFCSALCVSFRYSLDFSYGEISTMTLCATTNK